MAGLPLFELRIYQAAQVGYVCVLPSQVASGSWRIVADGGYESARFSLTVPQRAGSVASLAKSGRRIEAWGRSKDGSSLVRLWSGRIVQARREIAAPYLLQITASGVWSAAGRLRVPTPLVFPSRVDLSQAFAAAVSAALNTSSQTFEVSAPSTGLTTDSLEDAYEKPLRDAAGQLAGIGAGSMVFGGDVVGDQPGETFGSTGSWGKERLAFRPFEDGTLSARWTISIPDPRHRVTRRAVDEDASRMVNVLRIVGGALQNGNLLEGPTQDNARLDRITRSGMGTGNILVDPGFELNTSWSYTGASRKADTDVYGPADGNGKWFALLDNLGEKIVQRPTVSGGLIVGRTYGFTVRTRQATNQVGGSASTDEVTLKLRYFNASNVQVGTDVVFAVTPAGAGVWRDAQVSAEAPTGATQIEVEANLTARTSGAAASTLGVVLDNAALYDLSQITQRGWFLTKKAGSSAVITRQNWQAAGAGNGFGPYALEVSGTSSDDYDNDWWLAAGTSPNEEIAAVAGGQGLTLSYWLKRLPDGSANPKLILDIDWRDKSGAFISPSRATIAAGALTTSFVQYTLTASAPANATGAIVRLRSRGNGGFMLDAAQLRDSSETMAEFVRGSAWISEHRASSTVGLTAPQQASNALYGDIVEEIEEPLIRTLADANALALATFKARSLPIQRPTVEIGSYAELWRPGQWMRAIGDSASSFLPSPLPIVEVEGKWEGGSLSTTLSLGAEPDTSQRLLQRLLKSVQGSSSPQASGRYQSSGAALAFAGGGVSYPIGVALGGSGADLSATGGTGKVLRQSGTGSAVTVANLVAADLPNTAVTPGSYTNASVTVDAQGRLTAAASGSAGFDSTIFDGTNTFTGGAWRVIQRAPSGGNINVGAWPSGSGENARLLFVYNTGGASGTIVFSATAGTITGSTTLAAGALSIWSLTATGGIWDARRLS